MTANTSLQAQTIKRLLVANRGEIAVRVMRTAQRMGIEVVAVYSSADRYAEHVKMADDAVCIGAPAPASSYLNIESIIAAAKKTGANAIHPGYGFLAENELFASAVCDAGLIFVGPSASAIEAMGDKARAKLRVQAAGLPTIPGYSQEQQDAETLAMQANRIGFPIMIKASSGGGGRGMRRVETPEAFQAALATAQSEAASAFGDPRVILERALTQPRHVEVQILADQYGHCLHLGERDCSIQRRHQKIVEESPSPAVNASLRQKMGETAVQIAKSIGYCGAGTIEFLLDKTGEFFFMEMNTRLQVEHPVTEAITGLDLVEWQLRIAQGEPLSLEQKQVQFKGHAIEVRLCAEDPADQFLPQTGTVSLWKTSENARTDHALVNGSEVSPWYDSMLAKIIVYGESRAAACKALSAALRETTFAGLPSNLDFLRLIADHQAFCEGDTSTAFIEQHFADNASRAIPAADEQIALAALCFAFEPADNTTDYNDELKGFQSVGAHSRQLRLMVGVGAKKHEVQAIVSYSSDGYSVVFANSDFSWTCSAQKLASLKKYVHRINTEHLHIHNAQGDVSVQDISLHSRIKIDPNAFAAEIKSPMNGRVVSIRVEAGQRIAAKGVCIVLEAMKMEHSLVVPTAAIVSQLQVTVGQQVAPGQVLLSLEPVSQEVAS
ncbi:MAG: acetyl-CoA carboxylase biotin carboxylase subunit [Burkholderiales bacterium]|nr:acetyl-CoA carboxylase biotin carboxylase subunit [Burkholderiales bacterium]